MKWIAFLVLPLALLGCGGGGSSGGGSPSSDGGAPSQPTDLVGLWQGEVDGYEASLSIDAEGSVRGEWLDIAESDFYTVHGDLPMQAETSAELVLCEHESGSGIGQTFSPEGACALEEWSASAVEGQTIQGLLGDRRVELSYAGESAEPVAPASGCRSIRTDYESRTNYSSSDSTILNIMDDGSVTGSRTERIGFDSPTPGPVREWQISGEVTPHHIDGVDGLSLTLSGDGMEDEYMDGLIWEDLVYFVTRPDDRPDSAYRYSELSGCR